jgi:hypothetical protein
LPGGCWRSVPDVLVQRLSPVEGFAVPSRPMHAARPVRAAYRDDPSSVMPADSAAATNAS